MKILFNILIIIALPLVLISSGKQAASAFSGNYCNARFNFCITYPSNLLKDKFISDNEDGVLLRTKEDGIEVNVTGAYNILNYSLKELYEISLEDLELEVAAIESGSLIWTEDSYEFSLQTSENRQYRKVWFFEDTFIELAIKVPVGDTVILENLKKKVKLNILL